MTDTAWVQKLGHSIVKSVDISIGGGSGYWCTRCNKYYDVKP